MAHRKYRHLIIPIGMISLVCLPLLVYFRFAHDSSIRAKTVLEFNIIPESGDMMIHPRSYYLAKLHSIINVEANTDSIESALEMIKQSFDALHNSEDYTSVVGIRIDRKCPYSAFVSIVDILQRRMIDSLDIAYDGGINPVIIFWHCKHNKDFIIPKAMTKPLVFDNMNSQGIYQCNIFRHYAFLLEQPLQSFVILTSWAIIFIISIRRSRKL